jgi:hypothetical protein
MTITVPRISARWLAALLVVLFLPLLGQGSATAADGGGDDPDPTAGAPTVKFGIGPARQVPANQFVDGRAYLDYVASPGATISDEVALLNYGDQPLKLQLYATDALQADDGGFSLLPGGQKPTDAGHWISLDVPQNGMVTVPPRTKKAPGQLGVNMRVSIPADATPGDHVGGVVASLKVTSTNAQGAQVTLDQRIGLRAYFHLSGDLKPQLTIENLKATYDGQHDPRGRGRVTVSYTVHNTGNIRLDATQDVSVGRWVVGGLAGDPAPIKDILPGSRIDVTQTFERAFGLGRFDAVVTLHPTAVDATYTQTIPDVTAAKTFWAWPWILIAAIAGILLVLLGLVTWSHGRRRKKRKAVQAGAPASPRELTGAGASHRTATPERRQQRRARHGTGLALAVLLGIGPLVLTMQDAQARPPQGSISEVMLESGDATGMPYKAILDGWWGHEGGKKDNGSGSTFISMNVADDTGAVSQASVDAVHQEFGDDGTFDNLRVAFVPYSADGSNERPHVTEGESVADAYPAFADMGMGSALSAGSTPSDSVATISTGAEYKAWWDAGQPLQSYTKDLAVVDVADDSSTTPAKTPQGASLMNRWPAGQKISLVLYESDGTDKTRPGLPTVAVGPDGRAIASWLTFETVADPDDPVRSSAGYTVLSGAGTGPDAPVPSGAATGGAGTGGGTGGATGGGAGNGAGGGAGPADGSPSGVDTGTPADGTTGDAATQGAAAGDGTSEATEGDQGSDNSVIDSLPGGTPTFVIVLALLVLAAAAWATRWLRSRR